MGLHSLSSLPSSKLTSCNLLLLTAIITLLLLLTAQNSKNLHQIRSQIVQQAPALYTAAPEPLNGDHLDNSTLSTPMPWAIRSLDDVEFLPSSFQVSLINFYDFLIKLK
jgi:hypothetical protein